MIQSISTLASLQDLPRDETTSGKIFPHRDNLNPSPELRAVYVKNNFCC